MKRATMLLVLSVCLLTPSTARANDGGFWDWLFKWHTKFVGGGTDIHLACLDDSGRQINGCEEWYKNIRHVFKPSDSVHTFVNSAGTPLNFEDIRHEFNLRLGFYTSYGVRFPGAIHDNEEDDRNVYALKLMGMYYYRIDKAWDVGAGGGFIPLFGADVDNVWRGIVTASLVRSIGSIWYARAEYSYIFNDVTGADLGHPGSSFRAHPKGNLSLALGFDLRRR